MLLFYMASRKTDNIEKWDYSNADYRYLTTIKKKQNLHWVCLNCIKITLIKLFIQSFDIYPQWPQIITIMHAIKCVLGYSGIQ